MLSDDAQAHGPGGMGDRLAAAIHAFFEQVPEIQGRYRAVIECVHPDDALGLTDAWAAFHRSLVIARYDPSTRPLLAYDTPGHLPYDPPTGRHSWGGEALTRALEVAAAVSDGYGRLREQIDEAEAVAPLDQPVTRGVLLSRWRLARRGEAALRMSVSEAMGALDPRDTRLVLRLPLLGMWFVAYLEADLVLARNWSANGVGPGPAGSGTLAAWLRRLSDARERVEQLVLAPRQAPSGPPPAPPPDAGRVPSEHLGEWRAAVGELTDGYAMLVAECRWAMARLGSERADERLRAELVATWGRYDDVLKQLSADLGSIEAGAGRTVIVGLRSGLVAAVQRREEFLDRLAAARQRLAERDAPPPA